jgi:hypothetical protein
LSYDLSHPNAFCSKGVMIKVAGENSWRDFVAGQLQKVGFCLGSFASSGGPGRSDSISNRARRIPKTD